MALLSFKLFRCSFHLVLYRGSVRLTRSFSISHCYYYYRRFAFLFVVMCMHHSPPLSETIFFLSLSLFCCHFTLFHFEWCVFGSGPSSRDNVCSTIHLSRSIPFCLYWFMLHNSSFGRIANFFSSSSVALLASLAFFFLVFICYCCYCSYWCVCCCCCYSFCAQCSSFSKHSVSFAAVRYAINVAGVFFDKN